MINLIQVNLTAVVVADLISFGIGAAWYSKMLFAKPWMKETGLTSQDMKERSKNPLMFVKTFIA